MAMATWLFSPSQQQIEKKRAQERLKCIQDKQNTLASLKHERELVSKKVEKEHKYPNYFSEAQTRLMMIDRQIDRINESLKELQSVN